MNKKYSRNSGGSCSCRNPQETATAIINNLQTILFVLPISKSILISPKIKPQSMISSTCIGCSRNPLLISTKSLPTGNNHHLRHGVSLIKKAINGGRIFVVSASMVESSPDNSSDFLKRMEQAWLISQQPRPVACSSCDSNGHVECKWCGGTGFFILGDNMLCEVPSRNSSCVICAGKGSTSCSDCKGTGFRAKWLEQPPVQQ